METNIDNLTVGELAARDHRKAEIFRKYGIDFCCGGGQTIEEAARRAHVSEGELRSALRLAELSADAAGFDPAGKTIPELVDIIVREHHAYVRNTLPLLLEYGRKVAGHHGANYPELVPLEERIRYEAQDLAAHLDKEERVLFPAIVALSAEPADNSRGDNKLHFIDHCIERMLGEHQHSGESLEEFRRLTNNYTSPEGACNSFRFLYDKLREFEADLQQHIHLENNILFPKALALLEKQGVPKSSPE
jgi:regulator of cell morphogenesis and NO signaling